MRPTTVLVPDQLGNLLKAARLRRGATQAQLAQRLGISVQALSRLERNAGKASFDRIHRICLLLGLDLILQDRDGSTMTPVQKVDW